MDSMMRAPQEEGFALVETVIAAAIIATMLGLTYRTIEQAQRASGAVEERRQSMLIARSILSEVGSTIPLVPGSSHGESSGRLWRVDIAPALTEGRVSAGPLSHVTVAIQDLRAHDLVRLETLKLK